jgi:hypothetical protein
MVWGKKGHLENNEEERPVVQEVDGHMCGHMCVVICVWGKKKKKGGSHTYTQDMTVERRMDEWKEKQAPPRNRRKESEGATEGQRKAHTGWSEGIRGTGFGFL